MEFLRRSWARIDLDALGKNIEGIRARLAPTTKIMGVVKADAYGHGALQVAEELLAAGVEFLGVSNIHEGIALRRRGVTDVPILNFGMTPPELAYKLAEHRITQTVYCLEYAQALGDAAEEQGYEIEVHIKIDTGMARIGFDSFAPQQVAAELMQIRDTLPNLKAKGIFTHFAVADEDTPSGNQYTKEQFQRFMEVCTLLESMGMELGLRHVCNSGGFLNHLDMQLDMVRVGLVMYGLHPDQTTRDKMELQPVMSIHSSVSMVKELPTGRKISYGCTYQTKGETTIATVPIGYADGFSRLLSGKGRVIIDGQYAPVVGRVCMDQMMADVSDIPGVSPSSKVVIAGKMGDREITMEEWAALIGTVNYEVCCLISKRMPRMYVKDGEVIEIVDMIV